MAYIWKMNKGETENYDFTVNKVFLKKISGGFNIHQ